MVALLPARDARWRPTATELWLLALVTVGALAARLWRLGDMPPGLHVDEAYNLLDARAVLAGWRPVFLPANAGRDVLYTYLQAPFVRLLGETALAGRLASVVVGTAAVPATWLMARRFAAAWPRTSPPRVALAAATLMAFTFWPLHFSRYGIRAILFVPVVALAAAAWLAIVAARAEGTPGAAIGSLAVLLAAAAYAHPAGRAMAALPAIHAGLIWLRTRNSAPARGLAVAVVGAAVLVLPLAAYWVAHPDQFAGHAQEVSVLSLGPAGVVQNVVRVLAMFHLGGDPAPWRNLAQPVAWLPSGFAAVGQGRPVFDFATGLLMLVGLGVVVAAARRKSAAALLALVWFAGLLVPSMLTDAAPNFSRAIGALPFAVMFAALGADRVGSGLPHRWGAWFVAGWLALAACLSLRTYFVTYAEAPETPRAFDSEKAAAGSLVAELAAEGCSPLVAGELSQHPTLEVLARQDIRGFAVSDPFPGGGCCGPGRGLVWPAAGKCTAFVFLDSAFGAFATSPVQPWRGRRYETNPWLSLAVTFEAVSDATVEVIPLFEGRTRGRERGQGPDQPDVLNDVLAGLVAVHADDAVVVRVTAPSHFIDDAGTLLRSAENVISKSWRSDGPTFGGVFRLTEALVQDSRDVRTAGALLAWEVVAPPPGALNAFVHARDGEGNNVAQNDGWPLGLLAPSESLRVGERFLSEHVLDLSRAGEPASWYVGWYDWRDGARLTVHGAGSDAADEGTAYRLGTTIGPRPRDLTP